MEDVDSTKGGRKPSTFGMLKNGVDAEIVQYMSTLFAAAHAQKSNNGSILHELFRATMYSKGGNPTKWAKHVAGVYSKKVTNATKNPWKLQPPCLSKQLQGLVDKVVAIMEDICSNKSPILGPLEVMLPPPCHHKEVLHLC